MKAFKVLLVDDEEDFVTSLSELWRKQRKRRKVESVDPSAGTGSAKLEPRARGNASATSTLTRTGPLEKQC